MKKYIVLALVMVLYATTTALAATYQIDKDHSQVGFRIRHLAISSVSGHFGEFSGTFNFDPKDIKASSTSARINVASIDTRQKKRDDHLRTGDFFDAAKFPEMTFESRSIEPIDEQNFKVTGDLTMHGITKPVTLDVVYQGTVKDPMGNERAGFTATTKLNRRDFGINYGKTLATGALVVGNEAQIEIEIEGIRQ